MRRVLVYFGRFALIFVGYVAASLAASAFLHVVSLGALGFTGDEASKIVAGSVVFSIPFVALFVAYFAFLPSLPAILLSESFGWRDWLYYAIAGAAIGLVIVAFFIRTSDPGNDAVRVPRFWGSMVGGGMVGGMAYWLVAGRYAGNWRARARRRVNENA